MPLDDPAGRAGTAAESADVRLDGEGDAGEGARLFAHSEPPVDLGRLRESILTKYVGGRLELGIHGLDLAKSLLGRGRGAQLSGSNPVPGIKYAFGQWSIS